MSTKIISAIENPELKHALKEIYKRAATDPDFRAVALEDARAAFQAVGFTLGTWSVRFVEPSDESDDVLQLPPAIEVTADLSEEELEAVAGGRALAACHITCGLSCGKTG